MEKEDLDILKEKFPFFSVILHQENEIIGLIQNSDEKIVSFYEVDCIKTPEEKELFIHLCENWWWESNRMLPINIFIGKIMSNFRYCLRTYQKKEVKIVHGPCTSLNNILKKRIKRRQIKLVRNQ